MWIGQFYVDIIADDRNDYLNKRNKLCKDEPVLDPLDVGGLCQPGHHADQQGGGGQHHRQVHRDRRVEEVGQAEEGGGVADGDQQHRGKEGHHRLVCQTPLEDQLQADLVPGALDKGR